MSIEIIKRPTIRLTESEYKRLRYEFDLEHMFYSGPLPDFEDWVLNKLKGI